MGKRLDPQDVHLHMRVSKVMKARLVAEGERLGIPWTGVARMALGMGLDVMRVFKGEEKS